MRTLLRLLWIMLGILLSFVSSRSVHAGGVVPQGMGLYQDGRVVDFLPSSDRIIRWYFYGAAATERALGELSFAMGSVDVETDAFRVLYRGDEDTHTIVAFSFRTDPVWPECLDDTPGGCTLARTEPVACVKDGTFKFCNVFRIVVLVNNIRVKADLEGFPWEDRLYAILRHELGHTLGLAHDGTGPMANGALPFTACQLAKWDEFFIDPDMPTWSFPALDECQQAQKGRLAMRSNSCPNVE